MDIKKEECTQCHGKGIAEPNSENQYGNDEIEYQPIECQHCNGSGIEPE